MAIFQNFPTVRPTLNLNFARSKTLDPRITFTRSSIGTFVDEDGLIKTAAADEPRFDHDPATGKSLGILIEEPRSKISSSINYPLGSLSQTSSTDITAPDGTTSGITKITSPSFNNTSGLQQRSIDSSYFAHNVTASQYYTTSIYVYATGSTDSSRKVDLGTMGGGCLDSPGGISLNSCGYIDGSNIVSSNSPFTTVLPQNKWVRVFLNWRSNCTSIGSRFAGQVRALYWITNNQQNTNFINTTGNPVMYLWGMSVETSGSRSEVSWPTSYIYGSSVTRSADTVQITGTNFSSWYNQSEGTLFANSSINNLRVDNQPTAVLYGSNNSQTIGIGYRWGGSASGTTGSWINNNGDQMYHSGGNITSNNPFKQVLAYKTNDSASCFDGGTVLTDTTVVLPNMSRLQIGIGYSGYDMRGGHVRQIIYYPERLTNEQLQNLTK